MWFYFYFLLFDFIFPTSDFSDTADSAEAGRLFIFIYLLCLVNPPVKQWLCACDQLFGPSLQLSLPTGSGVPSTTIPPRPALVRHSASLTYLVPHFGPNSHSSGAIDLLFACGWRTDARTHQTQISQRSLSLLLLLYSTSSSRLLYDSGPPLSHSLSLPFFQPVSLSAVCAVCRTALYGQPVLTYFSAALATTTAAATAAVELENPFQMITTSALVVDTLHLLSAVFSLLLRSVVTQ